MSTERPGCWLKGAGAFCMSRSARPLHELWGTRLRRLAVDGGINWGVTCHGLMPAIPKAVGPARPRLSSRGGPRSPAVRNRLTWLKKMSGYPKNPYSRSIRKCDDRGKTPAAIGAQPKRRVIHLFSDRRGGRRVGISTRHKSRPIGGTGGFGRDRFGRP